MENDEKMMTGEESLRIITEMINKTKVNISQGSFHLLFWGWLLIVCSLSEWLIAKFTSYAHPYYVWFLVIPGSNCINDIWFCKRSKSKGSHLCR